LSSKTYDVFNLSIEKPALSAVIGDVIFISKFISAIYDDVVRDRRIDI